MRRRSIAGVTIELTQGDITDQPGIDAIVNAANAELRTGGGVAGAIHRAAGPALADECAPLAPIRPGECVVTSGQQLPNPHVIHCLGPVYGVDEPAAELLADCYRHALRAADRRGLRSVAFPALSTGAFGYPLPEAARVALQAVADAAPLLDTVELVRFVLHDPRSLQVHEEALAGLTPDE